MTDSVSISGLRVFSRHGVFDHEGAAGQMFVIDLVLHVDLSEAGATDDLGSTIDYGSIAANVSAVVAGERWNLIERVAERVAEVVLAEERCRTVEVTIHKPQAPITVPFDDVAVKITRSR